VTAGWIGAARLDEHAAPMRTTMLRMTQPLDPATPVTIVPTRNGPYEVSGEVRVVAPDGSVIRTTAKTYLCRCGHSQNKPFCDGHHRRLGWTELTVE
jgi:hypothetical protein